MKRREFFNYSLPATGAILLSPGLFSFEAFAEINKQFIGDADFDEYDLVINGGGLSGYFAAIKAANKGLKVLIIEKRSSLGFEITAKRRLWIETDGLKNWDDELLKMFLPEGELREIFNENGSGPNGSIFEDELLLFAGTVKKALLRNLLVNKVHILLMTDVCGILTDDRSVKGVLFATKHGLYSVKCSSFIDASDNLIFSRELLKQQYKIKNGGFVLELLNVKNPEKKTINVSEELGILNNSISLHKGKNVDHQLFVEFKFPIESQKPEDVEIKARRISAQLGKYFSQRDNELNGANIHYYALESSIFLENNILPIPQLSGHFVLPTTQEDLTCNKILEIKSTAENLVNGIKTRRTIRNTKNIILIGGKIPIDEINFELPIEPGLAIPLKRCSFSASKYIKNEEKTEVLVAGGGTAGAVAAMGALERGAKSIVIDYFNDLGGTKTMGGVMGYYHGMTDNSFIKYLESESSKMSSDINFSNKIGRKVFLLEQILKLDGKFITGAIICDTITENNKVQGIAICRNGKLIKVFGEVTIDATGDGDVAHFAGAASDHGNTRTGKTQNYSQWNITGGGRPPSNPTSDYDIIDNTKISELQRGLFLSHYEAHFYDFHPYLTVRESRRIKGLYELNLIDASEETHFEDMIGIASSDYDPHYVGNSEFTRCGFLLPHSNIVKVEIPYRSIVPADIDGLLVSGKAISQTHNALQFTRMSSDVTLLGYVTGQIAAHLVIENIKPKDYNVSKLQKDWFERGYFPAEYENKSVGSRIIDNDEIERRINQLAEGKNEYLYECCKLSKESVLSKLKLKFDNTQVSEGKLLVAKALAWFGESLGNNLIEAELKELFNNELEQGYPGGYIENYDFIRGREKNILEGLFWRINQNIGLLAMAGNIDCNNTIRYILENTTSGGDVISWSGDRGSYFNSRIDLRIIPFYNRIFNICFYAERNPDAIFITGFEKLLKDENIKGFITEDYHSTRWRVYGGNLELYIGAALARCGSQVGYELITSYLDDIHYNFKDFALKELKSINPVDYGFNQESWKKYISNLNYPQPCKKYHQIIEL
jgi:ribulose 1,5-bisphosphate synthetase/thiazole synthase